MDDAAFGHRFAMHLVIERILVRMFEDDPDGLAVMEAECLAAVDNMPVAFMEGDGRERISHFADSVQALFGGARSVLGTDE